MKFKLLLITLLAMPVMVNAQAKPDPKVSHFATASLIAFNPVLPKFRAVVGNLCKNESTKDVPLCQQDLNQKGGLVVSYLTHKIVTIYPTEAEVIKFGGCIRLTGAPTEACKPYVQAFLKWIPEVGSLIEMQDANLAKLDEIEKSGAEKK